MTTGQNTMAPPILQAGTPEAEIRLQQILRRGELLDDDAVAARVVEIVGDVRRSGDEAIARYTAEFDGVELAPGAFAVEEGAAEAAWDGLSSEAQSALEAARDSIRRYQESIYDSGIRMAPGFARQLELRWTPVRRVGIYVPGGRAAYPSTVLMTAVPALVAGVGEIAVVSPPDGSGQVHPSILAACHLCGVREIYRIGGAQAIAALAYGSESVAAVDLVVGPGNRHVTLAKRLVYGQVGIDLLAGPTELVVLADQTADARWVAADLLAQAEHDPQAVCILLTTSTELAQQVVEELRVRIEELPRKEICREALAEHGLVLVAESIEEACALADRIAPEHLSVVTQNAEATAQRVTAAGATFVGPFTPEVVGDYLAGPSHVLPTGTSARFCSGLSVFDFLVRKSRVLFEREALKNELPHLLQLARLEGLEAHARSASIRFEETRKQD